MSQIEDCAVPLFSQRMSLPQLPSKSEVALARHFADAMDGITHAAITITAISRLSSVAARCKHAAA
jgi:hypothetical protein